MNNFFKKSIIGMIIFCMYITNSIIVSARTGQPVTSIVIQKVNGSNIVYKIKESVDSTTVSYYENNKHNEIVYKESEEIIELNGKFFASTDTADNTPLVRNSPDIEALASKCTTTSKSNGVLNLGNLATTSAILAAILAITGPAVAAQAMTLVSAILAAGLKKVYYIKETKRCKSGNPNRPYKSIVRYHFYKDSKRKKYICTL